MAVFQAAALHGGQPGKGKVVLPGPSDVPPAERTAKGPDGVADYRSTHFVLHTDLSSQEAGGLLRRLETMLALVSNYWGRPLEGTIECYVVRDLGAWPEDALDRSGRAKIEQGAGITHVETLNRGPQVLSAKAVVYAAADRGTPEHEAVHAYCGQTFGRMGPLWYSEGMAEMGQYWRQGDTSVHCPAYVIDYLRASRAKPVRRILAEDDTGPRGAAPIRTGDSWQNYSWRWALCHLLANNPNYADRFRPLGLGYLSGAPVSFADTYGAMMDEIEFEYRFFLRHVDEGYRVDLCGWNWKRKFREPAGSAVVRSRIVANRGWQPSGAILHRGEKYDYTAGGIWQIAPQRRDVTADGLDDGAGRLEGVIFRDFNLSEPFALSACGTFTAPHDGRLFLRCRDKWNELADNSGFVAVKIKNSGAGDELARPNRTATIEPPRPADAE
ncbi:MAG: hypothetical protein WD063_19170 [Pirellulales bacterium]